MPVFKNYDGEVIEFPIHKHTVDDTVRDGSIALANNNYDGFMSKEDNSTLKTVALNIVELEAKLQEGVFIKK